MSLRFPSPFKIYFSAVVGLVFLMPISQFLSTRLLFILFIFSFFFNHNNTVLRSSIIFSWDIFVYLAIITIGTLYSFDLNQSIKVLETNFSFLAIPLVLKTIRLNSKKIELLFFGYLYGLSLASCMCLFNALLTFVEKGNVNSFFYYNLTEPIGFQPTYFAYHLSFGICLSLYLIYTDQIKIKRNLFTINIIFLFIILMLAASRTAYVGVLFILSFYVLKFLFNNSIKSHKYVAILSSFLLFAMLLINHYNWNDSRTDSRSGTDYWERFPLWQAALQANPNPLFGVGTGDYKAVLNQYYLQQGMKLFATDSYNSHNQFIQIYFSNGILGLLILCILICRPLYLSFIVQNQLGIIIIFPFIIYGITEVFLGRFQGIIFFVFCHQLVITDSCLRRHKLIPVGNKQQVIDALRFKS